MSRQLPQHVEERTYEVRILCPIGGPYTVHALRQRVIVDADGAPLMDHQGNPVLVPGGESAVDRVINASDPDAARIAHEVAEKIDQWAAEDEAGAGV